MKKKQTFDAPSVFKYVQGKAPAFPKPTCPKINAALDVLEELREDNSNLRENMQFWRAHCRELLKLLTVQQRKKYLKDNPIF